jgi:hypothetical protein
MCAAQYGEVSTWQAMHWALVQRSGRCRNLSSTVCDTSQRRTVMKW